jgi:vitamin B12/bleomycin/antimicrobial peptide transport system ATP-binding/permease protein
VFEDAPMRHRSPAHPDVRLDRETWRRYTLAIKQFATSEVRGRARRLFALLIALLLTISGLNVVNSYVGRDFMTAVELRDRSGFFREAVRYVGVFALLTIASVYFRFAEERLGLLWREWLTRNVVRTYLADRTYYRLHTAGTLPNPDQRIADDIRVFITSTLSLLLMLLNGTLTVLAFSGVLLSISPSLFLVGVAYAAVGSVLTIRFGRPLMWLTYNQADHEADFRADLVHVREHAESVAFLHREGRIEARLLRHLDALVHNLRRIIAVNRQLGFFTTGYNYLIPVIPVLVVAPSFMRGEIEFGVITQSVMAFSHLLGAFSLIVTQFQSISSYAAVLARLSALRQAAERVAQTTSGIALLEEGDRLVYEQLTLRSPRDGRVLIDRLSLSVPTGLRLLVRGGSDTARVALVRATAGIWDVGEGRIALPDVTRFRLLSERPYLPPGTLRELLVPTSDEQGVAEEQIVAVLGALDLERVLVRIGGLDVERGWNDVLSLDEQQLLSFARLLLAAPQFALLDRISTALSADQVDRLLGLLTEHGITYVSVDNGYYRPAYYDAVLELTPTGAWSVNPIRAGAEPTS